VLHLKADAWYPMILKFMEEDKWGHIQNPFVYKLNRRFDG